MTFFGMNWYRRTGANWTAQCGISFTRLPPSISSLPLGLRISSMKSCMALDGRLGEKAHGDHGDKACRQSEESRGNVAHAEPVGDRLGMGVESLPGRRLDFRSRAFPGRLQFVELGDGGIRRRPTSRSTFHRTNCMIARHPRDSRAQTPKPTMMPATAPHLLARFHHTPRTSAGKRPAAASEKAHDTIARMSDGLVDAT